MENEISNTTQNENDLEAEIVESAAIQEAIQDKLTEINAVLNPPITTTCPLNASAIEFVPSISDCPTPPLPPRREQTIGHLPKLNLASFAGDPLTWQSFWDSFDAAVNTNTALDGVQKFNYLWAQLHGDASRAIAGVPLTNSNLKNAITLLADRFGQPHKIINAHMQALLDITKPVHLLSSILTEIRVLESGLSIESIKEQDSATSLPAGSFHTGFSKHRTTPRTISCTYFQSTSHSSFNCDKISDPI